MIDNPILRVTAKFLIGPILLFALYVQFHGDFGPGGGFQAGVLFGVAFILYALVFGTERARQVLPDPLCRAMLAAGVLLYGGTGLVGMMLGDAYLDYSGLGTSETQGQLVGIWLVELGVGITVAAAMISIFFTYASYRSEKE